MTTLSPSVVIKDDTCYICGKNALRECDLCQLDICYKHISYALDGFFECKSCHEIEMFSYHKP